MMASWAIYVSFVRESSRVSWKIWPYFSKPQADVTKIQSNITCHHCVWKLIRTWNTNINLNTFGPLVFHIKSNSSETISDWNVGGPEHTGGNLVMGNNKHSDAARASASAHLHHLFEGHLQLYRLQGGGAAYDSHVLQYLHWGENHLRQNKENKGELQDWRQWWG